MKKGLIKIVFIFILSLLISSTVVKAIDNGRVEVPGAYYEINENQETRILDGEIEYIRDISTSHADKIDKDSYECSELNTAPQQVNILKIPSSKSVKIVNWRASEKTFWKKATVVDLARDFEANNPGWVVIAATNGDFFDINGNGYLPYQTTSATYSNGEMYRSENRDAVGFKNDGSSAPLVHGKWETTDLQLQIYDENENIIGTYDITNKNEVPTGNGVAVYFSYPVAKAQYVDVTIPAENSYIVERGYMLASDSNNLYAKGAITMINTEVNIQANEFAVVTTNSEITSKLALGTTIRIQKNLIGDYAECDNATGVGVQLLANGQATEVSDFYRHPRTTIGMTANGEIVLMTVDGRQPDQNMYGMSYKELQATMLKYGCVEAYNMDGGGSTTMILRNAEGSFDVMNSPSDGQERSDSNAVLVVAPRLNVKLDVVEDNSFTISYEGSKDSTVSNIVLHINNEEVNINSNTFTYNKLNKQTNYDYYLTYDLTYNGETTKITTESRTITTGKAKPILKDFYYTETDTQIFFNYQVEDLDTTLNFIGLKIGRKIYFLSAASTSYVVDKADITESEYYITLEYFLDSSTKNYGKTDYKIEQYVPEPTPTPQPEKKGCKKKSASLISIFSSLSVVVYLFLKKNK